MWCAENGRLEALWWPYELPGLDVELAHVDVRADPAVLAACEALLRATEDEAAELARPYFLALARRLQALFGLPVVREDPDAGMADRRPDEALAELRPEQGAEWAARGWIEPEPEPELPPGTVLHVPTRPGRLAGIYRQGWRLYATTALDPVARRQPPSSGRSSGSAAIPRCSPGCCPPAPSAPACGSTASQAPSAVAASYGVDGNEAPERRARDLLEIRLEPRLGRRGAGRAAIEAELQALPATIDGREETLALVAGSGVWVATWRDRAPAASSR